MKIQQTDPKLIKIMSEGVRDGWIEDDRTTPAPQPSHSPLPWRSGPAGDELSSVLNVPKGTMLIAAKRSNGSWDHVASLAQSAEPEANAAFIVCACNNAQQLADALKRIQTDAGIGMDYDEIAEVADEALAQYNEGK